MNWTLKKANEWIKENVDRNARVYAEVHSNPGTVMRRGFVHHVRREYTKYYAVLTNGDADGIVEHIDSAFRLRTLMSKMGARR